MRLIKYILAWVFALLATVLLVPLYVSNLITYGIRGVFRACLAESYRLRPAHSVRVELNKNKGER